MIPTRSDLAILLTATIDPKGMYHLARKEPHVRLADYKKALQRWLADPNPAPLIFCENSGSDLSQLKECCIGSTKPVEFLSFEAAADSHSYGKGYGEMEILQHALTHSSTLADARRIMKVTGRFYIRNAGALVCGFHALPDADVFCDFRGNLTWADSRVFCSSKEFLRDFLLPRQGLLDDRKGVFFEHALGRAAHAAIADGKVWSLMPVAPVLSGYSATMNRPISEYPDYLNLLETQSQLKAMVLAR